MVIYWDLILVVNFIFDFTLLLTVDLLLKRRSTRKRLMLASLVGEASMISLWINLGSVSSFMFKLVLTFAMVIVAFSYKDVRYTFYNAVYLYLVGIILGGFEHHLFSEFQVNKEMGFKYLLVLFLSPLVLWVYYKLSRKTKNDYNNRHSLRITYDGEVFEGTGYLDSGNKLVSPLNGKPIVLVEKEYIIHHKLKLVPIPYTALNHHGILYCFSPESLEVDGVEYKNILVGLSEVNFNIEGCNALLNARMENL